MAYLHKVGWINIYKIKYGQVERSCSGTQIYDSEEEAKDKAKNKINWLDAYNVDFFYEDKPWKLNRKE